MKFSFEKLKKFFIESDEVEAAPEIPQEVEAMPVEEVVEEIPEPEPEPEKDAVLVKLSEFRACTDVATKLLDRTPVFLDLSAADYAIAKRTLDFLGGVIFALQGSLKQVEDSVFYLTVSCTVKDSEMLKATYRELAGE